MNTKMMSRELGVSEGELNILCKFLLWELQCKPLTVPLVDGDCFNCKVSENMAATRPLVVDAEEYKNGLTSIARELVEYYIKEDPKILDPNIDDMTQLVQLLGEPKREILSNMNMPIVYAFMDVRRAQYIGSSRNGLSRPLTHRHHFQNREQCELIYWVFQTEKRAREYEREAIALVRPAHNKVGIKR